MLKLERFSSLQELLKYQKELYTIYTDNSVDDDVKEKVLEEILEIGNFLENTTTTNKRLIKALLNVVNTRDKKYQLQILSGVKKFEKIYKFNSFEDIEVEEKTNPLSWNAAVILREDVDILNLNSNQFSSSLFFRPEEHKTIYNQKLMVIYDAFLGDIQVEEYLEAETPIARLTELREIHGLTKEEIKLLDYIIFDLYKEEYKKTNKKGKVKVKK